MSLTEFVELKGVRKKIDENFLKPFLGITEAEIVAPPRTKHYMLVGTAFDYLFRFWLEANNENVKTLKWLAHDALLSLIGRSWLEIEKKGYFFLYIERNDIYGTQKVYENLSGFLQEPWETIDFEDYHNSALFRKVCGAIVKAESAYKRYMQNGDLSDKLIEASIDLAKIDGIFRSGYGILDDFREYDNEDIKDLKKLVEIIPKELFTKANRYLLNPTFGKASMLVGGADCDIIMDYTLIDIKTTKDLKLRIHDWRQLVGYCVLADLAKEELDYFPRKIKEIGIYYSRYGRLWTVDASKIYNNSGYEKFKKWFKETAQSYFSGRGMRRIV